MSWTSNREKDRRRQAWARMLTVSVLILLIAAAYSVGVRQRTEEDARDKRNREAMQKISWEQAQLVWNLRGAAKYQAKEAIKP